MSMVCKQCGTVAEPGDRFCVQCGQQLAADASMTPQTTAATVPAAEARLVPPELMLEVETNGGFVSGQFCQLRFRVANPRSAGFHVSLRMVLSWRGAGVQQPDPELEQHCRVDHWGDHYVFAFPFRPQEAGQLPLDTLRLVVSSVEQPTLCRTWDLPDRSLFVTAAPVGHGHGPSGIRIDGDLVINATDVYGSDLVIKLAEERTAPPSDSAPETPQWQAIRLRRGRDEPRVLCELDGCGAPIPQPLRFYCAACRRKMCRRHQDHEMPSQCQLCAEAKRADTFQRQTTGSTAPHSTVLETFLQLRNPNSAFRGRIWTERSTLHTTRTIVTVPRENKDCYRIGDQFSLNVQAERRCYLNLLNVGTSGRLPVLVKQYDTCVGSPLTLWGPDADHEWRVGGPPGVERIKAIFTTEPVDMFPHIREPGTPLVPDGDAQATIAAIERIHDLLLQLPSHSWTDAMCEFLIP